MTSCTFHEMNLNVMKWLQRKCYQIWITRQLQLTKHIRKNVPNDRDAPDVYLNARDKFRIFTFYEMKKTAENIEKLQRYFLFLVMYHCHKMSLHLLIRKGILSVVKSLLMVTQKISIVISQLSFSSFIHMCSINSVKRKM